MRPLGGFSHWKGMAIEVERNGATEAWYFSDSGFHTSPLDPTPASIPLGPITPIYRLLGSQQHLHPWEKVLAVSLLALSLTVGLFRHAPATGFFLTTGFILGTLLLRFTPAFRWHALEHKVIHVLASPDLPRNPEAMEEAIYEASPLHPGCGTNFWAAVFLLSLPAFYFLPTTGGLLASLLGAYALWRAGLTQHLTPLQWLVLAPPHPNQVKAVAQHLVRHLEALSQGEPAPFHT